MKLFHPPHFDDAGFRSQRAFEDLVNDFMGSPGIQVKSIHVVPVTGSECAKALLAIVYADGLEPAMPDLNYDVLVSAFKGLSLTLMGMHLTGRVKNILDTAKIVTLYDLMQKGKQFVKLRNCGKKSAKELSDKVCAFFGVRINLGQ